MRILLFRHKVGFFEYLEVCVGDFEVVAETRTRYLIKMGNLNSSSEEWVEKVGTHEWCEEVHNK